MASNPVDRGGKEQKNARIRIGERMGEDIRRAIDWVVPEPVNPHLDHEPQKAEIATRTEPFLPAW